MGRKVAGESDRRRWGVGSWAEEDIAGIAGWRISCAVRQLPYNPMLPQSLLQNVRLISNPAAGPPPVSSYLRLLWHQLPIKLGYLGGQRKGWRSDLFQSADVYFLSRPVDWKLGGRREVLKVFG